MVFQLFLYERCEDGIHLGKTWADIDVGRGHDKAGFDKHSSVFEGRGVNHFGGFKVHVMIRISQVYEKGAVGIGSLDFVFVFGYTFLEGFTCFAKVL